MSDGDALARVYAYHDRTKHHITRFARSPGYLDWATQPDPFRTFDGAPRVDLVQPLAELRAIEAVRYDDLFHAPDALDAPVALPRATGLSAVSALFRYSLGLSAWKQAGTARWALRVNPSSGNLHPTEGYAILGPAVASESPGVFHYAPDCHALEQRCLFGQDGWDDAFGTLPAGAFLVALTSIHWREAWKYGERAFRYCQHDVGHALAALRLSAALIGWQMRLLPGWSSAAIARALGVDRDGDYQDAEREDPACLCVVWPGGSEVEPHTPSPSLKDAVAAGEWRGRANMLSPRRVEWDAIDAVADATRPTALSAPEDTRPRGVVAVPAPRPAARPSTATSIILKRRSAVDMDGTSELAGDRFFLLLRQLMPSTAPPFDALWWAPSIHLVLFIHRVAGLEPGIYLLPRTTDAIPRLQEACFPDFAWIAPEPAAGLDLPLFLLTPLDVRAAARQLSCTQNIAADGYFSLGMLADFDAALAAHGPSFYRALFWEAGLIGQMLYLEAEAAGGRGTGIGCFFDDAVHQVLGIDDHQFQSLYHFTVGAAVDDPRLQTHPGYPWEA